MSRDLRRYRRQTNARLLAGFILLVLLVGSGLVYLFIGPAALPSYLLCAGAGILLLLLIGLVLAGLDWIVRRDRDE
jgi:hypothetical protein